MKTITLKFDRKELRAFNVIWDVELPEPSRFIGDTTPAERRMEKLLRLAAKELAQKFVKRMVDGAENTKFKLKETEAIVLVNYMDLVSGLRTESFGIYGDLVFREVYWKLDRGTA